MHNLLDTKSAAPLLGVAVATLENWRVKGIGPHYIKTPGVTGKVLYDPADIKAWREAHRSECTANAE